jgi:putative redox protein
MSSSSKRFDFTNKQGKQLSGRLELPESPSAFAVFAHCFTCSKNVKAATHISRSLAKQGIGVLRFDFTGLGNSEGDFSSANYSTNLSDIVAAADELGRQHEAPRILIGHSLGGTACMHVAARLDSVQAVCTIGSPATPDNVIKLFSNQIDESSDTDEFDVQLAGRPFRIQKQFIDDLRTASDEGFLLRGKSALIFHSPQDELVELDHARRIYEGLKHPKSFISLDGADHLLTDPADAAYVADTIGAWVSRYVGSTENTQSDSNSATRHHDLAHGEVLVRQSDGFTHDVFTADHHIHADEPTSVGGANKGMTPYDLLLAGLGACTSMTLKIYAEHKKIPLEHVEVRLRNQKIHAEDCASCESDSGKVDSIEKEIFVKGDLTPAQVKRMGEIADRCPVYRTITGEKQMVSKINHLP